ncbi:MAG TPA: Gfo/Idh/MocA family oxidoreductase [Verrucomicrobiae bacterium]|jgi:predicted dehydrogenase|nr:Gfo/Idh/MocA family oxidoreductase [Verrucomicrobiae bacterium]
MKSAANSVARFVIALFTVLGFSICTTHSQPAKPPVRIAIVGLEHDHALGIFPRLAGRTDVQLVGIVETNQDLITRYTSRFHLDPALFYLDTKTLFAKANVQAVAIFSSTFSHERIVEACAAQGVDVMMEKPMATTVKQARAIEAAVKKSGIQLIVNYETSWYPATQAAYTMVHDDHQIGALRKMVFHDGHRGPVEIGCSTNFLAWLTDPVLDGGGAVNDFGCYGADMATWFMDGQKPISVFATVQHLKPEIYPKVEDDATIVITYPGAQVILQPSWNWPFDRKDMEVYGQTGTVFVPKSNVMRVRTAGMANETEQTPPALTGVNADPVSYLAAVARNEIKPTGLASLEVNVIVVEILEAAHKSAETGKLVKF